MSKGDRTGALKGVEEEGYRILFRRYQKTENFIRTTLKSNPIVSQKGYYDGVKGKIPRKVSEIC